MRVLYVLIHLFVMYPLGYRDMNRHAIARAQVE